MEQLVRFEILGPIRIWNRSIEVAVTAGRERILLAMLLLQAGHYVDVHRLIDAIWGDSPPRNAASQVHGSVYRLRKRLSAAGVSGQIIVTEPAGYRAQVDPRDVDLWEFRRLRDEARNAAADGQPEEAKRHYRAALGLWRGGALAGIDSDVARQAAAALDDERVQALEERIGTELALGAAGELVPELTTLVQQYSYREGLRAALMRALYRAGRPADALAAYRQARQILHDELGTEPSAELQRLHQAILNGDPDPAAPPAARPSATPPAPRELPADVAGFTGREEALRTLDELLPHGAASPPAPVVISAIAGTAGVGKTALAVHWAHRAADRFPDGQLYINLRGYDPEQPMSPADALARFLGALGVAGQDIPLDLDGRAARFRSEVAERRMLIVLDNASSVEQVRPLLPGSGSCAVLVTSRDRLSGLVAIHGAHRLDIDLLPAADAIALLRWLIGPRVDADPEAAATLAEQCARLPLALRVAAELAASRPTIALADLVIELADRQGRLDALDVGSDPHAAVRGVFSWSIQHLAPDATRTFRVLGLHPGPDFDAYAAAALADTDLDEAGRSLELLASSHLLHPTSAGRYGMHDLLRAYATELATTVDAESNRRSALTRLFDYFLAAAAAAMDSLHPAEMHRRPRVPPLAVLTPALADPDTALTWLDSERPCLVATAAYTATHGWPTHTMLLSSTLYRYLEGGHYTDAMAIHRHAYEAAQAAGGPADQARALRDLGAAYFPLGEYESAADHLRRALALFRRAGDRSGEALALTNLGSVAQRLGHYRSATDNHKAALVLFRRAGDHIGEAQALANLGSSQQDQGHYAAAADYGRQALALFRQLGNPRGEAHALDNLGSVEELLGSYQEAIHHHQQALAIYQRLGNLMGEARALENLGIVHVRLGLPERATEYIEPALILMRRIGDHDGEAWALNSLGEAAYTAGRPTDALTNHTAALTIASEIGTRDQQARAHAGIGNVHRALHDPARARIHYEHALALYTDLGMREADEVRTDLSTVTQPGSPDAQRKND